jgi:hypothetical protein
MAVDDGSIRMFRLDLIERLAFESPVGGIAAFLPDAEIGVLAERLGVHVSALSEAKEYVRRGFRPAHVNCSDTGLVRLRVWVPKVRWIETKRLARRNDMQTSELLASVLHQAMQLRCEPTPRSRLMKEPITYTNISVSRGLCRAIGQRAAALGMQMRVYARSWLLDFVDGNLPAIHIQPLPLGGMFDDARSYVLPNDLKKSG